MNISFSYYPEGKTKVVTMSYDDGQIYDRKLVEIFNKYGIKGTFHLNSGKLDSEPFLNTSEIKELFEGHEVSVHTLSHPHLTKLPEEAIVDEIMEDRKKLESLVGYPVRGMSYPFGDYSEELLKVLPVLGIEYARTVNSHGNFTIPENFLVWHPTCHHDDNLLKKCEQFQKLDPQGQMPMLYVWGHSFEFERNNNWDLIEEFCKTIANDETIWYATNIEIMDYIKAMKSLKFSANQKMIFNPSALSVWINADGKPLKIEGGKHIYLYG